MRHVRLAAAILGVLTILSSAGLCGAEWPQYRGVNQDGISAEDVNLNWNADGPKVVWKAPTNLGLSSFAVAGGRVFTDVLREINGEPREVCMALDAATGKELWIGDLALGKGYSGGAKATARDPPRRSTTAWSTWSCRNWWSIASMPPRASRSGPTI